MIALLFMLNRPFYSFNHPSLCLAKIDNKSVTNRTRRAPQIDNDTINTFINDERDEFRSRHKRLSSAMNTINAITWIMCVNNRKKKYGGVLTIYSKFTMPARGVEQNRPAILLLIDFFNIYVYVKYPHFLLNVDVEIRMYSKN